ncbi:MAG: hypothetical protein H0A76_04375 [Candidatus Thiodubiliella endoseptemdiera]|uniref:Uncharacterized protein n=1 Tax=Candidatus Thiodubiliella endoseptemdiera TaxID=2738886 RepID=A0A853F616_9GAMM|nr:hypothetical protein [Candidatus Thiodubiliella endoseptemdiera]
MCPGFWGHYTFNQSTKARQQATIKHPLYCCQQTGSNTATKIGNKISEGSNKTWSATKNWWNTTGSEKA